MIEFGVWAAVCAAAAWFLLHETDPRGRHRARRARSPRRAPAERPAVPLADEDAPLSRPVPNEPAPAAGPAVRGDTAATEVHAPEQLALLTLDVPEEMPAVPLEVPPSSNGAAIELGDTPVTIASLADPRAHAAAAHPDYEIVELPVGPTIVRIGAPRRRPDPSRLIQTEVLLREGPGERLWAVTRLTIAILAFGLILGFGLVGLPRIVGWIVRLLTG